jgi:hypothetical protein
MLGRLDASARCLGIAPFAQDLLRLFGARSVNWQFRFRCGAEAVFIALTVIPL